MVILNDLSNVAKFPKSVTWFFFDENPKWPPCKGHNKIVSYNKFNIYCNTPFSLNFSQGAHLKFYSLIRVLFAKIRNGRLIQNRGYFFCILWSCNLWRNSSIFLYNIFFLHNFSRETYWWSYFNIVKLLSLHISKWPPLGRKNNFRNYVVFCLHIFLFGNVVAVKIIS